MIFRTGFGICQWLGGVGNKMKVWNKRDHNTPTDAVYVGRPTKFGNHFVVGEDGTRREVIKKYRDYLKKRPVLLSAIKKELKGKDLVCWCAPLPCHADVLLEIANED
jgi:hypothetical protein